ncbi:MAG: hypothetical protein ABII81_12660 [Pseudomonadota bacterium]
MKVNTEAFARYHSAKESLAEYMQIGAAAIQLLKTNISVTNGAALLGQFVDACDMPHWGEGKRFPNPINKTQEISEMLCRHVLVQQISAFDLFSRNCISDFSRFSKWASNNCPNLKHEHAYAAKSIQNNWHVSPCCNEVTDKLGDLKERLNQLQQYTHWKPSQKLESIIPLFHLARRIRNRIVHSDGIIGSDLEEYSKSNETSSAFTSFAKGYTKSAPPLLPVFTKGEMLCIAPVHAIFFGAVVYEIAKEINQFICSKMDDDDMVKMAFHYGCLVETHPFRTIRHKTTEARIKHFLSSRYNYKSTLKMKDISVSLNKHKVSNKDATLLWRVAVDRHNFLANK